MPIDQSSTLPRNTTTQANSPTTAKLVTAVSVLMIAPGRRPSRSSSAAFRRAMK